MNNLIQLLGFALVVAFSWFVWEPLPLLVSGLVLVVAAEVRQVRARRRQVVADGKPLPPGGAERLLRGLQAALAASRGER